MPKLMSVAATTASVRDRTKTVTRRMNWWEDKHGRRLLAAGDIVTLCEKVQGRKHGEPIVRICDVEIVSLRREPLNSITRSDVIAEGFLDMTPVEFLDLFIDINGCQPDAMVTRIEWRYAR